MNEGLVWQNPDHNQKTKATSAECAFLWTCSHKMKLLTTYRLTPTRTLVIHNLATLKYARLSRHTFLVPWNSSPLDCHHQWLLSRFSNPPLSLLSLFLNPKFPGNPPVFSRNSIPGNGFGILRFSPGEGLGFVAEFRKVITRAMVNPFLFVLILCLVAEKTDC